MSFMEQSPVGESTSNGTIERWNLTFEDEELPRDPKTRSLPVLQCRAGWLVEFAAVFVNRCEVGHEGKTPYERLRGMQSQLWELEFWKLLHFRRDQAGGKLVMLDVGWEDGVFLGYRTLSGEIVVGTSLGVKRTRRVRRKPAEERWSVENLRLVTGVPWQPAPGRGLSRKHDAGLGLASGRLRGRHSEARGARQGVHTEPDITPSRRISRSSGELLGARDVSQRFAVPLMRSTPARFVRGCKRICSQRTKAGAGSARQMRESTSTNRDIHTERATKQVKHDEVQVEASSGGRAPCCSSASPANVVMGRSAVCDTLIHF